MLDQQGGEANVGAGVEAGAAARPRSKGEASPAAGRAGGARSADEPAAGGTQSIERAIALLLLVGRAGAAGARLADIVAQSALPKPTVRRVLLALVRTGLVDQDATTRRYHMGPEAYVLGTLASARFGIHQLSLGGLSRLAQASGDSAFLSVPRDTFAVCLHREEGSFPIRTHVLQAGDRHPLGIGAGSLALLAALPDAEVERVLRANGAILAAGYPAFTPEVLRAGVADARRRGYALNPGQFVAGSWGIGVAVRGISGPVGALSIAAIESRLGEDRQRELVPALRQEAAQLEAALRAAAAGRGPPAPAGAPVP